MAGLWAQHEPPPVAARAEVRGGENRPAGVWRDHQLVAAADRERAAPAVEAMGGERGGGQRGVELSWVAGHVPLAAAVAEHLEVVLGGQPYVQRHAVGDEVVGEQGDGHVGDDGGRTRGRRAATAPPPPPPPPWLADREPGSAPRSGRSSTTPRWSSKAPSTSTSDMNGPIWRGGKLTTPTTSVSSSSSRA